MRRALFAREFRSALVPNLVTVGAILVTLVVVERFYGLRLGKAEDVRVFIDTTLLAGLVASGFISGERCFPADFKESRTFFLSSLPLSRTWAWLIIVSARLLAALLSSGFAVVLRHPLLGYSEVEKFLWWGIALTLSAYGLLFSAGALFALLFRRTFISYVAGFILLGILIIETLFSSSYAANLLTLEVLVDTPVITFEDPLLPMFLIVLALLLLFLSWRFFIRGEFGNLKRRIRNQILFGATVAGYLGCIFCAASSTHLASLRSGWSLFDYRVGIYSTVRENRVSFNGRYLFLFETTHKRPFIVRVSIVDNQTGRLTYQSVYGGLVKGYWSDQGNVLSLLVLNNSPLDRWGYLVAGTADWIRLSPKGREISRRRLRGIEKMVYLRGSAIVALREGGLGRVYNLDGTSGHASELIRARVDGNITIRNDGSCALVCFDNIILPKKAWVISSRTREVKIPRTARAPFVVFWGRGLGSLAEIEPALRRKYAPPMATGGTSVHGHFLLPFPYPIRISGPELPALYFVKQEDRESWSLWARSTNPEGRWKKVPDINADSAWFPNFSTSLIDLSSGVGAFLAADEGSIRLLVYDPGVGAFMRGGTCAANYTPSFLNVDRVSGLGGVLIELTCTKNARYLDGYTDYFEYLPGSGKLRKIKTVLAGGDHWLLPLYLGKGGEDVWISEGTRFEIWRSSPRAKDLRIWPPQ